MAVQDLLHPHHLGRFEVESTGGKQTLSSRDVLAHEPACLSGVILGQARVAGDVPRVVDQLHEASQRMTAGAIDELVVLLTRNLGDGLHGLDDVARDAAGAQLVGRDPSILDDVVEPARGLGLLAEDRCCFGDRSEVGVDVVTVELVDWDA